MESGGGALLKCPKDVFQVILNKFVFNATFYFGTPTEMFFL